MRRDAAGGSGAPFPRAEVNHRRTASAPSPGIPGITDVPLRLGGGGRRVSARLLASFEPDPAASRRDALAGWNRWAQSAEVAVAVLPASAGSLFADLRALGFDDAGPLPRYAAPARPGFLRRSLTWSLLPAPRVPSGTEAIPEPLPIAEEEALRARLAADFGALPEAARPEGESSPAGARVMRNGRAVAGCRWDRREGAALAVREWLAPHDLPDIAAALAREALRAAAAAGAVGLSFETTHAALGKGLLLARFLPRSSRARVLVRQGGDRAHAAPSTADWHLAAPARILGPVSSGRRC